MKREKRKKIDGGRSNQQEVGINLRGRKKLNHGEKRGGGGKSTLKTGRHDDGKSLVGEKFGRPYGT